MKNILLGLFAIVLGVGIVFGVYFGVLKHPLPALPAMQKQVVQPSPTLPVPSPTIVTASPSGSMEPSTTITGFKKGNINQNGAGVSTTPSPTP